MTAIERVTQAAASAGMKTEELKLWRGRKFTAADGHFLAVDFDSTGRLTEARHYGPDSTHPVGTMPASGLEARVLGWVINHAPAPVDSSALVEPGSVQTPAGDGDPFEVVESSTEAADAFAQGGASGLAQLDERRSADAAHPFEAGWSGRTCSRMVVRDGFGVDCGQGPDAPVHADPNEGQDFDHGRTSVLAGRRLPRKPHAFEGITAGTPDRPCTRPGCGLADRHPIHGGYTAGGGLTQLAETGGSTLAAYAKTQFVRPPMAEVFELTEHLDNGTAVLKMYGVHLATMTTAEAQLLRDTLVEHFGPAPTDH
jgi:hypothetical protein